MDYNLTLYTSWKGKELSETGESFEATIMENKELGYTVPFKVNSKYTHLSWLSETTYGNVFFKVDENSSIEWL